MRNLILILLLTVSIANAVIANASVANATIDDVMGLRVMGQSVEDGLSDTNILSLAQDKQGFVWVGTWSGMSRFDGSHFDQWDRFTDAAGQSFRPAVFEIVVAADNGLWLATNRGLYRIDPQREAVMGPIAGIDNRVRAVIPDASSAIVLYSDGRIVQAAVESNSNYRLLYETSGRLQSQVSTLLMDHQRHYWLFMRDGTAEQWNHDFTQRVWQGRFAVDDLYRVLTTPDGQFWLSGLDGNLLSVDPVTHAQQQHLQSLATSATRTQIYSLCYAGDNRLWIGSADGQGFFYNIDRQHAAQVMLQDKQHAVGVHLYACLYDSEGRLWVGGYGGYGGPVLAMEHRTANQFHTIMVERELALYGVDHTGDFQQAGDGRVYAASSAGLLTLNPAEEPARLDWFRNPDGDPHYADAVKHLFRLRDDRLLLVTTTDLWYLDPHTHRITAVNLDAVQSKTPAKFIDAFVLPEGTWVLVHSHAGAFRFDPQRVAVETYTIDGWPGADHTLHAARQDGQRLWISGVSYGIAEFDLASLSQSWRISARPDDGLAGTGEVVDFLYDAARNTIWLATISEGLRELNLEHRRVYPVSHMPAEDSGLIYGLELDQQQRLWLATNAGLFRYDPQTADRIQVTTADGLASNQLGEDSLSRLEDGRLIAGSQEQVMLFDPNRFTLISDQPQPYIQNIQFNHQLIPRAQLNSQEAWPLQLDHQIRHLGIQLSAIAFDYPRQTGLAYKLSPFDEQWIAVEAGQSYAHYTNLPPGEYTFSVRARNRIGEWLESPQSLTIQMRAAPWLSWQAKLAYILLLLLLLALAYRWRTRQHRAQREYLQAQVAEKTARLQKLVEDKDTMLAAVSHELKTPLSLLITPLERLTNKRLASRERERLLQLMQNNVHRISQFVDQILALSRLRDHAGDSCRPVDIGDLLQRIGNQYQPLLDKYQLDLDLQLDTSAGLDAIPQDLEMLVNNLLSNAIKYSPPGGAIWVRLRQQNGSVVLEVEDQGSGIPPESREAVFQRFHRLSQSDSIPGAGLGLALVAEIVDKLNGEITVGEGKDGGALFVLRLPCSEQPPEQFNPVLRQSMPVTETALAHDADSRLDAFDAGEAGDENRQKILIIEDEPDLRELLYWVLCPYYSVHCVADGDSGWQYAVEQIPDLIVCDLYLPKGNGLDLTRKVRQNRATSHIPIILTSARTDESTQLEALRAQADIFSAKPFRQQVLLAQIEALLQNRRILRSLRSNVLAVVKDDRVPSSTPADPALSSTPPQLNAQTVQEQGFLQQVENLVMEHYSDIDFSLLACADQFAMSERQLRRKLKALTGEAPNAYLYRYRVECAWRLLQQGETVEMAAEHCGFANAGHLRRRFREHYGVTPSTALQNAT